MEMLNLFHSWGEGQQSASAVQRLWSRAHDEVARSETRLNCPTLMIKEVKDGKAVGNAAEKTCDVNFHAFFYTLYTSYKFRVHLLREAKTETRGKRWESFHKMHRPKNRQWPRNSKRFYSNQIESRIRHFNSSRENVGQLRVIE
jgi:hypothetical protein